MTPLFRPAQSTGGIMPQAKFTAVLFVPGRVTPALRGYESAAVGRRGLRGKEPQYEPRHGHGACPRAAKARPADAVPPP